MHHLEWPLFVLMIEKLTDSNESLWKALSNAEAAAQSPEIAVRR